MCGPVDEAAGMGISMVGVVVMLGAGVGVGSGVYMLSSSEVCSTQIVKIDQTRTAEHDVLSFNTFYFPSPAFRSV